MEKILAALTVLLLLFLIVPVAAGLFVRWRLKRRRRSHALRPRLWEFFYGLDWREVTTNNYGFAPAEGDAPERFQHQMYMELLNMLRASGRLKPHTDLLEVSCGRGGGLAHLVRHWPGSVSATGLDIAQVALCGARRVHAGIEGLAFVRGSALALPFADGAFDAVVNVEASNDYGDYRAFYREAHRVLRPGGALLHCDTRWADKAPATLAMIREAGFETELRDITANVVEACRLDGARRLELIGRVPWYYRLLFRGELRRYGAIEGSAKFEEMASRRRLYLMVCALKPPA